jgi:hypothetical protein
MPEARFPLCMDAIIFYQRTISSPLLLLFLHYNLSRIVIRHDSVSPSQFPLLP